MSAVSPSIGAFPFGDHTQSERDKIQKVATFDPRSNANKSLTKNEDTYTNAAPCYSGPAAKGKSGTAGNLHYTVPSSAKVPSSATASGICHLGTLQQGQNDRLRCPSKRQGTLRIPSIEASSGISKMSSVVVLPNGDHDMVERLCVSINELRDKIANKWDHYDKLHRQLPSYDVGPVSRPQLFPNTTHTSIFKGRSSPSDIPKPAAPRPPLKVLPLHGLSGTGIISVYDCQHMYRAGRVGKHENLQKIYFDVDNAPKYRSDRIEWGNLRPLLQKRPKDTPPKAYKDLVELHNAMLGIEDKLSTAEPGIAVSAPKGKWEKETIGLTSQEDLAEIRKERAQNYTASYVKACAAALDAVGVTEFRGDLIRGLDGLDHIASSPPGINGHAAYVADFQKYKNGGYQPFTLALPAINVRDGDDFPNPNGDTTEHRPPMKELHRATTADHQGAVSKYHANVREHLETIPHGNFTVAIDNNAKVDAHGSMNKPLDPVNGIDGAHALH